MGTQRLNNLNKITQLACGGRLRIIYSESLEPFSYGTIWVLFGALGEAEYHIVGQSN